MRKKRSDFDYEVSFKLNDIESLIGAKNPLRKTSRSEFCTAKGLLVRFLFCVFESPKESFLRLRNVRKFHGRVAEMS